jgi:hypothetical protein
MPVRNLILHPDFIHRVNDNDTVDSICLYCFGTVASLPKEMDLEEKEYAHACLQKMQHTRLAGEVTRSLDNGIQWCCYVRAVLHAPRTRRWGVTVCMVNHKKARNAAVTNSVTGLSDYKFNSTTPQARQPQLSAVHGALLFLILAVVLLLIFRSCSG